MISGKLFLILATLAVVTVNVVGYTPLTLTKTPFNEGGQDFTWRRQAIQKLWRERREMGYTPIRKLTIPGMPDVDLLFKDESSTKTGNLKHRFSWALYMWALLEGHVNQNTTVFEASSGNTATSEAYMAQLIGVPFIAVIPDTTEETKVNNIKKFGGQVLKTDISSQFQKVVLEAEKSHGFYMNQFANADKAEEFHESTRGQFESTNVMYEILQQLKAQNLKEPDFFVHTAGTGGTISSAGRYIQKYGINTKVIMADTEFSIYYDYVINGKFKNESGADLWTKPGMAGTGFGYGGPAILSETTSLQPSVIDAAYKLPDLASTAAMHVLRENGITGGTSTGMNFLTSLSIGSKERARKNQSPLRIVTILADSAALYEGSYYNLTWIEEKFASHGGIPVFNCWKNVIRNSYVMGNDPLALGGEICSKEAVMANRSRRLRRKMSAFENYRFIW